MTVQNIFDAVNDNGKISSPITTSVPAVIGVTAVAGFLDVPGVLAVVGVPTSTCLPAVAGVPAVDGVVEAGQHFSRVPLIPVKIIFSFKDFAPVNDTG